MFWLGELKKYSNRNWTSVLFEIASTGRRFAYPYEIHWTSEETAMENQNSAAFCLSHVKYNIFILISIFRINDSVVFVVI